MEPFTCMIFQLYFHEKLDGVSLWTVGWLYLLPFHKAWSSVSYAKGVKKGSTEALSLVCRDFNQLLLYFQVTTFKEKNDYSILAQVFCHSFQFAEEFNQSLVKFSGFVNIAGMARSFQLQHEVIWELYEVLVGLGTQICVLCSKHNQSGSLKRTQD